MKVINFYGGPGTGKSLQADATYCELKKQGINCELVTYAKDKFWDQHDFIFENQFYIFAKQLQRIQRLKGRVDYVVTDSPLLLQTYYYKTTETTWGTKVDDAFLTMVPEIYRGFDNIDIFLGRNPEFGYQEAGRFQKFEEAQKIDGEIRQILDDNGVEYKDVMVGDNANNEIMNIING